MCTNRVPNKNQIRQFILHCRSPMQSPSSRNGQFSPGGARHLYCPVLRHSPHYCKSPISPRDSARKINVYSPNIDSDCSDYDSKLVLRQPMINLAGGERLSYPNIGLLIVDHKREDKPKWIKKLVRRFSSVDFETSSLVSGQSRGIIVKFSNVVFLLRN